jgi:hypothetical protein
VGRRIHSEPFRSCIISRGNVWLRPAHFDGRDRKHLTPEEVERLEKAVKGNRNGTRDWLLIHMAARHGLPKCHQRRPRFAGSRCGAT